MIYLLDTDTCVFALRHSAQVLQRLEAVSPDDVAVCTMTEAELWYGAWKSHDPAGTRRAIDAFLSPIGRLPFDSEAAERHAELRFSLRAQPIGERDLVIASVASAAGMILITHNQREFRRTGLPLEDWST